MDNRPSPVPRHYGQQADNGPSPAPSIRDNWPSPVPECTITFSIRNLQMLELKCMGAGMPFNEGSAFNGARARVHAGARGRARACLGQWA